MYASKHALYYVVLKRTIFCFQNSGGVNLISQGKSTFALISNQLAPRIVEGKARHSSLGSCKKDGLKFARRRILDLSHRPRCGKASSASEFFFVQQPRSNASPKEGEKKKFVSNYVSSSTLHDLCFQNVGCWSRISS